MVNGRAIFSSRRSGFFTSLCQAFLLLSFFLLYALNSLYVHGWCEPFIQCDEGKKRNVSSIVFVYLYVYVFKVQVKKETFQSFYFGRTDFMNDNHCSIVQIFVHTKP